MKIALPIVTLERIAHPTKPAPLNSKGAAPRCHPRPIAEVVCYSSAPTSRKNISAPPALPFGDGQSTSGSCADPSPMHFTGKERDTETGLDNFGARYDSSSMGRFMSVDPAGLLAANFENPQTLNLYAYTMNNPLRYTDPTGMYVCADSSKCDTQQDKDF